MYVLLLVSIRATYDNNYYGVCYFGIHTYIAYGDLRNNGSHNILEFQDHSGVWAPICKAGFHDDDGNVACWQLGYRESSSIYSLYYAIATYVRNIIMLYVASYVHNKNN